jgi:hypothetical protein
MSDYDVIVIGSGAGGGTLVHRLAPSGAPARGQSSKYSWAATDRVDGDRRSYLAGSMDC